jgi:hypothetical protein
MKPSELLYPRKSSVGKVLDILKKKKFHFFLNKYIFHPYYIINFYFHLSENVDGFCRPYKFFMHVVLLSNIELTYILKWLFSSYV